MPNIRVVISAALLCIAIVFGGGGSPAPATELVVEVAAVVAIVAWAWLVSRDRDYPRQPTDRVLLTMAVIFAGIPLIQLIPLPPAIWHSLPGRAIEIQSLALVGGADAWMPLSESPTRTLASLLSLIAPMTMLFMVSRLAGRDRLALLNLLGIIGLVTAVMGAIQLASGSANWLRLYHNSYYGFATGFQANRNAQADILLVSAMALATGIFSGKGVRRSRQYRGVGLLLVGFLLFSVVLTGSRTGVALAIVGGGACAIIAFPQIGVSGRRVFAVAACAALAAGAVGYALRDNARIENTLQRFSKHEVVRPEIWQDTWYAIGKHWPVGSGVGTFQPILFAAERLEYVRPSYSNRAHNDYLEFALEVGILAPLYLCAALVFAFLRIRIFVRHHHSVDQWAQCVFVVGSLLVFLLHSFVDYPMRSMSLAVVAGLVTGLLARSSSRESELRGGSSKGVER